jgi:hypothetical protein
MEVIFAATCHLFSSGIGIFGAILSQYPDAGDYPIYFTLGRRCGADKGVRQRTMGSEKVPGIRPDFQFFAQCTAGISQADLCDLIRVLFSGIALNFEQPHPFHVKEVIMDGVKGQLCPGREGTRGCRAKKLSIEEPEYPFFIIPYEIRWCPHPYPSSPGRPLFVAGKYARYAHKDLDHAVLPYSERSSSSPPNNYPDETIPVPGIGAPRGNPGA